MTKIELFANGVSEFAPIVTFIFVSEIYGFTHGLIALIIASIISLAFSWYIEKRIPKFGLIATFGILMFGIISIITSNPFFIIIKDTLYALSFGLTIFIGILFNRSYLKVLFGDFFAMTEKGWRILTIRWACFFMLLAISNEIARQTLTPNSWLYYKFISVFVTWIFAFYQFTLARKERLPEANEWGLRVKTEVK
jgi:intracellular septation protein